METSPSEWVYSLIYLATIPCFFAHVGIIGSICLLSKYNKPFNYLVANLSIGTLLNQCSIGLILLERHVSLGPVSTLCGIRAVFFRLGMAIISFTLTEMVLERSYISRNPIYGPIRKRRKCTPTLSALGIDVLSFLILIPTSFSRDYDPAIPSRFKCIKIFLWGKLAVDYLYRIFLLLTIYVVPTFILFRELIKIRRLMHALDPPDIQIEHGDLTKHRLRLMKNSCLFIFMFATYSLPFGILDTFDATNITFSPSVKYYQEFIRDLVLMVGYVIITVSTLAIFYINRQK